MGISINIAGLNQFIQSMSEGNIFLIEGDIDPIKTLFAQNIAYIASKLGWNVVYISSYEPDKIEKYMLRYLPEPVQFKIVERHLWGSWREYVKEKTLLIIDSFSYLILDKGTSELSIILEEMRRLCKQNESIILLVVDRGMLEEKIEVIISHLSDGIIRFNRSFGTEKNVRYISIPKWTEGQFFDENIYYTFSNKRINVDLRERVI